MKIKTLAQAKEAEARIVSLEKQMDKAQANPAAWKRTLGCPGTRFLPEWERLMEAVTGWLAIAPESSVESFADYSATLRQ